MEAFHWCMMHVTAVFVSHNFSHAVTGLVPMVTKLQTNFCFTSYLNHALPTWMIKKKTIQNTNWNQTASTHHLIFCDTLSSSVRSLSLLLIPALTSTFHHLPFLHQAVSGSSPHPGCWKRPPWQEWRVVSWMEAPVLWTHPLPLLHPSVDIHPTLFGK